MRRTALRQDREYVRGQRARVQSCADQDNAPGRKLIKSLVRRPTIHIADKSPINITSEYHVIAQRGRCATLGHQTSSSVPVIRWLSLICIDWQLLIIVEQLRFVAISWQLAVGLVHGLRLAVGCPLTRAQLWVFACTAGRMKCAQRRQLARNRGRQCLCNFALGSCELCLHGCLVIDVRWLHARSLQRIAEELTNRQRRVSLEE